MTSTHALSRYVEALAKHKLLRDEPEFVDAGVEHLTFDSRAVVPGTLFVCKGAHFSPEYAVQAGKNGAVAYVSEQPIPHVIGVDGAPLPALIVTDIRRAMVVLGELFYNRVWDKLHVIGITGTKGKSSSAYFMRAVLDAWMHAEGWPATAILSSIDNYDGVIDEESHLTTPEALDLFAHFNNAVNSGITHLTMEVSSQALKYDRVDGVTFDVAAFLNIGVDHISPIEHKDYEDYISSKLKIFRQAAVAVVNFDTRDAERILRTAKRDCPRVVTFSATGGMINGQNADIAAKNIAPTEAGNTFTAVVFGEEYAVELGVPGAFNVDNALAVIGMCHVLGVPQRYVVEGLAAARVPGRMEPFTLPRGVLALVDYAHNALSFEKLFDSVEAEYPGRPVSIVFGAPGGKAFDRRRSLGAIAGQRANRAYLTEEDCGEESATAIAEEIATHVREQHHAEAFVVPDRGEAIRRALVEAPDNSVVLITGKGRETRMKRGLDYVDTPSDTDIVAKRGF